MDTQELRKVLGSFVTGVTVITALDQTGEPLGVTVNSFSSVSLDPPLILWSQSLTAPSHARFRNVTRFNINVLSAEQLHVSQRFAGSAGPKYVDFDYDASSDGVPLIRGAVAYLECSMHAQFPGGDHMIFLGRVESFGRTSRPPLLFGLGRYLLAYPHSTNSDISQDEGERYATRLALPWIEQLSEEHAVVVGVVVWGNLGPTVVHWSDHHRHVGNKLRTGTVLPILTSAAGRIFAAYLPEPITGPAIAAEVDLARVAVHKQHAAGGIDLQTIFREVREQRLARIVDSADFLDRFGAPVTAVAAPVFDKDGKLVLALTAVGYSGHLDPAWTAPVPAALHRLSVTISATDPASDETPTQASSHR